MSSPEKKVPPEVQLEQLLTAAERLYNPELPYHNSEHAQEVIKKAEEIINRCKEEGLEVNEEVVRLAILFHDAGYHENPEDKGFKSKEEYAAHLAEEEMEKVGMARDIIDSVTRTIMATHSEAPFNTVEQKVVRAADLAGMASDYEVFIDNNKKLKKEHELLSGKEISWEDWQKNTEKVVNFYLSQNIKLTKGYEDEEGNSIFHNKVKYNLDRFLEEDER